MLNRVALVGRLTRDPEIRYTPTGLPMAITGIAVDKPIARDKIREGDPTADFFNLVAWRQTAEFAGNYLTKGRLVAVDGRLQQRSWVDQQGQKRSVVEVVVDRFYPLDRREEGAEGAPAAPRTAPTAGRPAEAPTAGRPAEAPHDDFADVPSDDFDPFADQ